MPKADLVLEGGGVKGLGLVGAVLHLMREGYTFPRVGGTSAGSIVAAFLAAGATADERAGIVDRLEYPRVPDRGGVPGVGEGLQSVTHALLPSRMLSRAASATAAAVMPNSW